jgi:hypothetical protein
MTEAGMHSKARFLRRLVAGCTLSAVGLVSLTVAASGVSPGDATAAERAEATGHFAAGKEAALQQRWEKAALELRASLEVVDSPNARLVLARALRDWGKTADAWAEYGRTAGDATKLLATEGRYARTAEAARAERAELEPRLAFVTVTVVHAPSDATLRAAGRLVPADERTGPVVVPAGAVDVVLADARGKELARQTVSASPGQKTAVSLDGQPPPPPPPKVATVPSENEHEAALPVGSASRGEDPSAVRPYAYAAGGIGVVGWTLFAVFGLVDNATYRDLQSACPHNVCPPGKQTEVDAGRTQQLVANVGLVVGAAGVAAGLTLFVVSLSPRTSGGAGTGLVVMPGYVGLRGCL